MEKSIKITTEKSIGETSITVDNSTDFKDFVINHAEDNNNKTITFQINTEDNNLEIDGIDLTSTELHLLREFLNQLK